MSCPLLFLFYFYQNNLGTQIFLLASSSIILLLLISILYITSRGRFLIQMHNRLLKLILMDRPGAIFLPTNSVLVLPMKLFCYAFY